MNIYKICEQCNKEFKVNLETSPLGVGDISTMQDCPHCKDRNDIWIRVVEVRNSQNNIERNDSAELAVQLKEAMDFVVGDELDVPDYHKCVELLTKISNSLPSGTQQPKVQICKKSGECDHRRSEEWLVCDIPDDEVCKL